MGCYFDRKISKIIVYMAIIFNMNIVFDKFFWQIRQTYWRLHRDYFKYEYSLVQILLANATI